MMTGGAVFGNARFAQTYDRDQRRINIPSSAAIFL